MASICIHSIHRGSCFSTTTFTVQQTHSVHSSHSTFKMLCSALMPVVVSQYSVVFSIHRLAPMTLAYHIIHIQYIQFTTILYFGFSESNKLRHFHHTISVDKFRCYCLTRLRIIHTLPEMSYILTEFQMVLAKHLPHLYCCIWNLEYVLYFGK